MGDNSTTFEHLTKLEMAQILHSRDKTLAEALFRAARETRQRVQGNVIFAYGFVFFSTYCRNNCNFCYFRKDNAIDRYRKSEEDVLRLSKQLIDSGVNLIDLTMGEDLRFHEDRFEMLIRIIHTLKRDFGTSVMISPGVVSFDVLDRLAEAGADFYALYQETHNRALFQTLRVGQDYDERMQAKLYAKQKGMWMEEGILIGVGETAEDIAESIEVIGEIGARQARAMSFVPQKGSPMELRQTPDRMTELKTIALMRVRYPDALIPASLDVDGIEGLQDRLDAGANLVTSIIPPQSGLMGVAHCTNEVDSGGRTIAQTSRILEGLGLRIATNDEYRSFLARTAIKENWRRLSWD